MAKPSCLTPSEDYTEELTYLTCKESIKASPAAPMVPYEVRQARGRRASEAPEWGAPWGADGFWVAGGLNKGFVTLELVK